MYTACIATLGHSEKLKSLRLTIRALKAQSLPPEKIIVAINGEVDIRQKQLIEQQSPSIDVVFAAKKMRNVSYARNVAANGNQSRFIAFLDDDTVLAGVHVMQSIMLHAGGFDFACGAKRFWAPPNWDSLISEANPISYNMQLLDHFSLEPININRADGKQRLSNYSFIGNFGIIEADCFERSGRFDEDFVGWGYEDADLMQQLFHMEKRFLSLQTIDVICYHLSHFVDKSNVKDNIKLYESKIVQRGQKFHLNHHFGIFENDGFSSSSLL